MTKQPDLLQHAAATQLAAADVPTIAERLVALELRVERLENRKKRAIRQITDDEREAAEKAIAFLNKRAGAKFRAVGPTLGLLVGRLREGYTGEDIRKVIWHQVNEWRGTAFEKHLRPSTLFAPAKFAERVDVARLAYDRAQEKRA